jgi:CBS domain-containing protein
MSARDLMTKDIITIEEDCEVNIAIKTFLDNNIGCLPVIDSKGFLRGIITETDFIYVDRKLNPTSHYAYGEVYIPVNSKVLKENLDKLQNLQVRDIMTKDVKTIKEDTSLEKVVNIIINKNIKNIPVVKDDKLVGIVTRKDVLRYYLQAQN